MARRSVEKAVQGGLSLGAYGALQGQKLRKKYGNKGVGAGAALGTLLGATTGYLQGEPDPSMGEGVFAEAAKKIRMNTMKQAQKAGDQAGTDIQNIFARRNINSSPLVAGVEAATRGNILARANESLIPLEANLEMRGAQDRLQAERVAEYEKRQGWADTALAIGMAGKQMTDDIMARYAEDKKNADAAYQEMQSKILPSNFGVWSAAEQAGYLTNKGLSVPDNWGQMSATERLGYVNRAFGMSIAGPADPVYSQWPKEGQFPQFAGFTTAEEDAAFNQTQYGDGTVKMVQKPDGTWEAERDAADRRTGQPEITPPPQKPTPGFDGSVQAPGTMHRPMISKDDPNVIVMPDGNMWNPKTGEVLPGSSGVTDRWADLKRFAQGEKPTPGFDGGVQTPDTTQRPTREASVPPIDTTRPAPNFVPGVEMPVSPERQNQIRPPAVQIPQGRQDVPNMEQMQGYPGIGREVIGRQDTPNMEQMQGYPGVGQTGTEVFEQELRDLIDWGEGGFRAQPFDDPTAGVNVGFGRSLTYNGMSVPNEIVPFLQENGLNESQIQQRLSAAGVSPNSVHATLNKDQFNALFPEGLTRVQGRRLADADIAMFTSQVETLIGRDVFSSLDNARKQVLIDMMYTLGAGDFKTFQGMIDAIREGDYDRAADEMKWVDPVSKSQHTDWYDQVGPRRADPLLSMMRTGWRVGTPAANDQSRGLNTIPTVVHDALPKEVVDQIQEAAKTPPTQAELQEFSQAMPESYSALLHPTSPFAGAATEPYTFQVLQQTAALMGDAEFARIIRSISQIAA